MGYVARAPATAPYQADRSDPVQFDPIDREGIEAPASSQNKEGQYQCKKHGSLCTCCPVWQTSCEEKYSPDIAMPPWRVYAACNQCYGWKKQISRARVAAKKAGKKSS